MRQRKPGKEGVRDILQGNREEVIIFRMLFFNMA